MNEFHKKIILIFMLGISLLGFYAGHKYHLYGNQIREEFVIPITFYDPASNTTVILEQEIIIIKPTIQTITPLPAIMELHGDIEDHNVFNILNIELVRNGYIVVLIKMDFFNATTIICLNATLEYLLNQNEIDPNHIGIMGHSRGAHYVSVFANLRSDSIQATICMNFGNLNEFILTHLIYHTTYTYYNPEFDLSNPNYYLLYPNSLPSELKPLGVNFTENSPRNLLLISDNMDPYPDAYLENYLFNLTNGKYIIADRTYGSFDDGSARRLTISESVYGHVSGLYNPNSIYMEILWFNKALDNEVTILNIQNIQFQIITELILIIFLLITGIGLIVEIFSSQRILFQRIYLKISESTSNNQNLNGIQFNSIFKQIVIKSHKFFHNYNLDDYEYQILRNLFIFVEIPFIFVLISQVGFPNLLQYYFFWIIILILVQRPFFDLIPWHNLRMLKKRDLLHFTVLAFEIYFMIYGIYQLFILDFFGDIPFTINNFESITLMGLIFIDTFIFRLSFIKKKKENKTFF